MVTNKLTSDYAAMEAAERALVKAKHKGKFDPDIFNAVAKAEVKKIRESLHG